MSTAHRAPVLRRISLAIGLLAAAPLGCAGEVVVPAGASHDCAAAAPAGDVIVPVKDPTSGVFIGDALHLEAEVSGERRYVVLDVESPALARLAATPSSIAGRADLAPLAEGLHARVIADGDENARAEVIDTADPAAPAVIGSLALDGVVDAPAVFSVAGDHLYFCMTPPGDTKRQLFSVDLGVPAKPGAPQVIDSFLCNLYATSGLDGRWTASGSTWVSWNLPTGSWVQSADVYRVSPTATEHVVDYGYNQTGVHHYGNVVRAATSGVRAVWEAENDEEFLLASGFDEKYANFAWGYFTLEGQKSLLAVVGEVVYLATPGGVRAYDISDIMNPSMLSYHASIDFGSDVPRLVAASDRYLAIATGDGTLYLVPLDAPGAVAPLTVYQPPATTGCAP